MRTVGCGKPSNRTAKSGSDPEWGVVSVRVQFSTGVCLSGFFIAHLHMHPFTLSGNHTAGCEGKPLLWERYEIEAGVAKIVPLTERLSGMCGSVQHVRSSPLTRRARRCSPSSIGVELEQIDVGIDMSKKKKARNKKYHSRFQLYLDRKSMELDWLAESKKMDDNTLSVMLYRQSPAFLLSPEWKELRQEAIKKYGSSCLRCGRKDGPGYPINIDHIKPRKFYPQLALDITNLQPLCHTCNKNKGNGKPVDYR